MKRHYFFLIGLLLQLISVNVFAQSSLTVELGDPLVYDESQITSNASDSSEGQNIGYLVDGDPTTFWHSDYHNQVTDPHYVQFELLDAIESGNLVIYLQRRQTSSGNHLKRAIITASEDGETWELLDTVVFANPGSGTEALSQKIAITKPYWYIRMTNCPMDGDKIFFHAAEIQLFNPTDDAVLLSILNAILVQYDIYYYDDDNELLNMGTNFGQHTDYETLAEFKDFIGKIFDFTYNPDAADFPKTEAEAQALSDKADELYNKILASEVLYSLPAKEGYYRILADMPYKQTVKIGEDEIGIAITEVQYTTKAIFASLDGYCSWGTLKEDRANYIWKLTQVGDSIDMYNVGMDARIGNFGSQVTMSATSNQHVMFDFAANENDHDIIYIRSTQAARGSNQYLHMKNHSRGTQTEDQILCVWNGTYTMGEWYTSDRGTSEWYLEPVSEEEALALAEAFEPIKNHDLLVEKNNTLRTEVGEALTIAKDVIKTKLLTSGEQMSSPFSQNDNGNRDGGDLSSGVLIDGDKSSYWHSYYGGGNAEDGTHYIQLSGMKEMVDDIQIYVARRSTEKDHPTIFGLYGSDDEFAEDEEWTRMATIELGNASSGQEYTTPAFNVGSTGYEYVRVYAMATTNSRGYWHSSELQIYRLTVNPSSQYVALGDIATELDDIYKANVATADADITIEQYNALLEAYERFKEGVVDPTELRNAISDFASAAEGYVEGDAPGYWATSDAVDAFNDLYNEAVAYDKAGRYTAEKNRQYAAALSMAAKAVTAAANGVDPNTWYRIMFPTEEMYDAYGWNKSNCGASNIETYNYGNYVTAGEMVKDGDTLIDIIETPLSEVREGQSLHFIEEDYMEDPATSYFRFIPTENELVLGTNYLDLVTKANLAIAMTNTYKYSDNLITDASQLSSNASDSSEGQHIEYLIDGKPGTFWHTDYHNNATAPHYLQIALNEPISDPIQLVMTRRQGTDSGAAARMFVQASKDAEEWVNLGYIELPFAHLNETVTSAPVELGDSYSHIRFILTRRTGSDVEYDPFDTENWTYFHAAEVVLRTVTTTSTPSEANKALKAALAQANLVIRKDVTVADYKALATAYNAVMNEINAGKHPVAAAVKENPQESYLLQNKATGLFIYAKAAKSNDVSLELIPSVVDYVTAGYGESLFHIFKLDGTDCGYFHSQNWNHRFVTWSNNTAGSNSGLVLQIGDPVTETEFTFIKNIRQGKINSWCTPVTLTNNGDGKAYSVAGMYVEDSGEVYLALNEVEKIEAGRPTIYLYGNTDLYDEESEVDPMEFTISADAAVTYEAGVENGFYGCLKNMSMNVGDIYFSGNEAKVMETTGYALVQGGALLRLDDVPTVAADADYDYAILISEAVDKVDGVQQVVKNISTAGKIFTLDGRLVRANGTIADLKALGRGTYIVNGVKVLVK